MRPRPIRFLLVDDQEANLIALEGLLKRDGLELLKASSARAALEVLLVHDVDLAFLDVQMAEMDGFELAELMRGTERTRGVPIIFLTAGAVDNQRRFRGYEAGAVDFLFKPLEPHILRSKAGVFFELARQRNDLRAAAEENARLIHSLRLAQQELEQHANKLEETVEQRTRALRETISELETFSYSITHDMRGPLRAMTSFAQLLQEEYDGKLDDTGRDYLRRIVDGAGRMDHLIRDVLQYSRVSSEQLPIETVDIEKLLQEVVDHYPDIALHRASIHVGPECASLAVKANLAALTQVLSNLLNNALKFRAPQREPEIHVRCEVRESLVRIIIQDNGIGIAPEHLEKIFGMFERLHTVGEYPGTGIGLSIVKRAVERMGGSLGVDSALGEGSQFWLELPNAAVPFPPASQEQKSSLS